MKNDVSSKIENESVTKKKKYQDLLKEKNYVKEVLAAAISRFGDGIDTIAFSWLVYKITGSTLLVATLFAVNGLPNLIFGISSGVITKYASEKKIMAICDFGRGLSVALIAILFMTDNLAVWHLYVITFLNSSFESFRAPAAMSIMPKILSKANFENGVAFSSSLCNATQLAGLAIAPLAIGILGLGGAVVVDAVTFVLCGLLVSIMKLEKKVANSGGLTVKSYFADLKEGFHYIVKDKFVLNICVFGCVINALVVPLNALQAPFVDKVLKTGSESISIMSIGLILAMSVGSLFAPKLKQKFGGAKIFIFGGLVIGLTYCILAFLGDVPRAVTYVALAIDTFVMGIGIVLLNFPIQIAMFMKVPQEYLSRVAAIMNALLLCSVPITSCILGIVSKYMDLKQLFILFGVASAVVFLSQIFNKYIREFDKC